MLGLLYLVFYLLLYFIYYYLYFALSIIYCNKIVCKLLRLFYNSFVSFIVNNNKIKTYLLLMMRIFTFYKYFLLFKY